MALFKCSLCVCALLCASMAGATANVVTNVVTKQTVPNGVTPFSIVKSASPIAKVIEMIQRITDEVSKEAIDEKSIFDNFACFCKDKTKRLTIHVNHHATKIRTASTNIADWTAQTNEFHSDIQQRNKNHEEFSSQFADYKQRLATETTNWENIVANYKANKVLIDQALNALTSLTDAKKQVSAELLQVPAAGIDKIQKVLAMGDALGLITAPKQKALATSLLQGAAHEKSANPLEGYEFHQGSDDIIDLITSMKGQIKTLQKSDQEDHVKADNSYKDMITVLRNKIDENQRTIEDVKHSDSTMRTEIAQAREVLIEEQSDLSDSDGVLKQVTSACESRATEYDARFAMRKQELVALTTAMACLKNSHLIAKSQGSNKATGSLESNNADLDLLQSTPASKSKGLPQLEHTPSKALRKPNHVDIAEAKAKPLEKGADAQATVPKNAAKKSLSFLQEHRVNSHEGRAELSLQEKQERQKQALGVILSEGQRAKSLMLTSLAVSLGDDPFAKVIRLISDLRWRLEEEEHGEVDKVVWCRESLEKAKHERNTRFEEVKFISMQVHRLEAKTDELIADIAYQSKTAKEIGESMVKIYTDVAELSAQQLEAMNAQKEAREELQSAITTLRSFYSMAAVTSARQNFLLLQVGNNDPKITEDFRAERRAIHVENADRRDADGKRTSDRNERNRQRIGDLEGEVPAMGRQGSLGDALALMETIVSDFDREIGNLQGDLDEEHAELVKSNQILLSQKTKAEELRDLEMADLKTTKVNKEVKYGDMKTSMNLLDDALQELELLKPTCVDTGMSYAERVKAREVEMDALSKALCILGETDEKFDCPPSVE